MFRFLARSASRFASESTSGVALVRPGVSRFYSSKESEDKESEDKESEDKDDQGATTKKSLFLQLCKFLLLKLRELCELLYLKLSELLVDSLVRNGIALAAGMSCVRQLLKSDDLKEDDKNLSENILKVENRVSKIEAFTGSSWAIIKRILGMS